MRLIRPIVDYVIGHPKSVLGVFMTLTLFFLWHLLDIRINSSSYVLPPTHPSRVNLQDLRQSYNGSRDVFMVVLEAEKNIFNINSLNRIAALTQAFQDMTLVDPSDTKELQQWSQELRQQGHTKAADLAAEVLADGIDRDDWENLSSLNESLKKIPTQGESHADLIEHLFVRLAPLIKVSSMANTQNITAEDGILDTKPPFPRFRAIEEADVEDIKAKVAGNKLWHRLLFTEDHKNAIIALELAIDDNDSDTQALLHKRIIDILTRIHPGPETFYIAGFPVVSTLMTKTIESDSANLFPIVFAIVLIALLVTFKSTIGVLVPLFVVFCSLIWTMGTMAIFDIPLDVISVAMPVFILSIGVADGIHLVSEYFEHLGKGQRKPEALRNTILELAAPVTLTSITTGMAFFILSITEIEQLKYFGRLVALGTMVAMVFSLLAIPSFCMLLQAPDIAKENKKKTAQARFQKLQTLLNLGTRWAVERSAVVIAAFVLFGIFAAWGLMKMRVDNDPISFFPEDAEIVLATEKLNRDIAGSIDFNILVSSNQKEAKPMRSPENLHVIRGLLDFLQEQKLVGKAAGIPDLIQRINYVMHDNDPAWDKIPAQQERIGDQTFAGKDIVSQYLFMYGDGPDSSVRDLLNPQNTEANIKVVCRTNSSYELNLLREKIRSYIDQNFPEHLSVKITGRADINVATTEEIVAGQMTSFCISMVVTFALLMFLLKSAQYAIYALIPILYTILAMFGIMGYLGISLNIGTSVVTSVVIGIGVDYSIHYLTRLRLRMSQGMDLEQALYRTVSDTGKAISFNALTVGVGFLALLFSVFRPLETLGWIIFVCMSFSAMSTMILVPAIMEVTQSKKHKNTMAASAPHSDQERERRIVS